MAQGNDLTRSGLVSYGNPAESMAAVRKAREGEMRNPPSPPKPVNPWKPPSAGEAALREAQWKQDMGGNKPRR